MHKTLQRSEILNVLRKSKKHFTAYEIHRILISVVPQISLATVYRNLEQMSARGMIKKVRTVSSLNLFEADTSEHFHVWCPKCGKLENIKKTFKFAEELKRKQQELNCEDVHIEFVAVCKECKEKAKLESAKPPKPPKKPLSLL